MTKALVRPFVLGLTGSVGMGKSTTAAMFCDAGVPVWDADATVHRLYAPGGAGVAAIAALTPAAQRDGQVDRAALREWAAAGQDRLSLLEAAIHPLVAADRTSFLAEQTHLGTDLVVLDIPLLFETGAEALTDATVVVTAPADVQAARVLARPGMTPQSLAAILARQMPDAEKRRRASFVIVTDSLDRARTDVLRIIGEIRGGHARNRP